MWMCMCVFMRTLEFCFVLFFLVPRDTRKRGQTPPPKKLKLQVVVSHQTGMLGTIPCPLNGQKTL